MSLEIRPQSYTERSVDPRLATLDVSESDARSPIEIALVKYLAQLFAKTSLTQPKELRLTLHGACVYMIIPKDSPDAPDLVLDEPFKNSFSRREDLSAEENRDLGKRLVLAARHIELGVRKAIANGSVSLDEISDPSTLACRLIVTDATDDQNLTVRYNRH